MIPNILFFLENFAIEEGMRKEGVPRRNPDYDHRKRKKQLRWWHLGRFQKKQNRTQNFDEPGSMPEYDLRRTDEIDYPNTEDLE
jgi:hypothetical protein